MWLVYSKRSLKSQLSTHITDINLRQYARALYEYIYVANLDLSSCV